MEPEVMLLADVRQLVQRVEGAHDGCPGGGAQQKREVTYTNKTSKNAMEAYARKVNHIEGWKKLA